MDRKQAFLLGAVIAFAFTTLYFAYPPFGVAVIEGVIIIRDGLVYVITVHWPGVFLGAGAVSMIWGLKRWDKLRALKIAGKTKKETEKELGTFAPSSTIIRASPAATSTPATVVETQQVAALEEKKANV